MAQFAKVVDQFDWRKQLIENALDEKGVDLRSFDAIIGRGGIISPIESGVYEVNDDLRRDLLNARMQHASNLGGLLARDIADEIGVKSYIADPVVVDEMMPYAGSAVAPSCRVSRCSMHLTKRLWPAYLPRKATNATKSSTLSYATWAAESQ